MEPKELLALGTEHQTVRKCPEYVVRNCAFCRRGWEGIRTRGVSEKILLNRIAYS